MKIFIILALLLSSCASNNRFLEISKSEIEFIESSGKIALKVNEDGEWEYIKSSGSAALLADNTHEIEQAMIKATLRAKANLAEFIKSEIKSEKSTKTITNLVKDDESKSSLLSNVSEEINSNSTIILQGVHVIERKISDNKKYVFVTVKVTKISTEVIKKLQ